MKVLTSSCGYGSEAQSSRPGSSTQHWEFPCRSVLVYCGFTLGYYLYCDMFIFVCELILILFVVFGTLQLTVHDETIQLICLLHDALWNSTLLWLASTPTSWA